jgi:Lon protease-like protein
MNQPASSAGPEIPLFPLNSVLAPGGQLALKLFETRYLDMAARCMREKTPFGVALIKEGGEVGAPALSHTLGTTARITHWDMNQPGLLFITVQGEQRFQIEERRVASDRLQYARVRYLPEPTPQPVPPQLAAMLPLLQAVLADAGETRFPEPHRLDDATWVGYRMAEILPIPALARQRLLELDDTVSRLEIIDAYLRQHKLIK